MIAPCGGAAAFGTQGSVLADGRREKHARQARHGKATSLALLIALAHFAAVPSAAAPLDTPLNPYKFLVATHRDVSGIVVGVTGPDGASRLNTVSLDGKVWQNDPDQSYVTLLEAPPGGGVAVGGVPVIDVPQFISDHAPVAQPAVPAGPDTWQVHASGIGYFVTTGADPVTGDFSLRSLGQATISVRDTAVWMFPKGLRVDGLVTVTAVNPGACLIIVANRNGTFVDPYGAYFDVAMWFFGGMNSASVPVVLSTSHEIRLEQIDNYDRSTEVAYLSMYAGSVRLTGPRTATGHRMRLHHAPAYEDDDLIDRLSVVGALPLPGSGPTAVKHSTWGRLKNLYRSPR